MSLNTTARLCLLAAFTAAVCAVSTGQSTRGADPSRREVNEAGVSFAYSADDFAKVTLAEQPRKTAAEAGTDIPVDVFPASRCFILEGAGAGGGAAANLWGADNFICLFPLRDASVENFGAAYPHLSAAAARVSRLFRQHGVWAGRLDRFGYWQGVPQMPFANAGISLLARTGYLDFRAASGILFMAQHSQEMPASPANNRDLGYHFQGVTKDGRHYVAARFAVDHPALPKDTGSVDYDKLDKRLGHLRRDEKKLNGLAEASFRPSLKSLKALLSSIEIE